VAVKNFQGQCRWRVAANCAFSATEQQVPFLKGDPSSAALWVPKMANYLSLHFPILSGSLWLIFQGHKREEEYGS
jgi:hypothetical protein